MHNGRVTVVQHRGLNFAAPFWKGQRAEIIVAARVEAYAEEKAAKRAARRTTPSARSSRNPNEGPATFVPKELRRLERALMRRKTLAARQRVRARIDALKRELTR